MASVTKVKHEHDGMEAARRSVGGAVAGMSQVLVGHPFDTLKVRLQTLDHSSHPSAIRVLKTIIKQEGFLALYKGVSSPLLGIGFCNSVVFAANGFFRDRLAAVDSQGRPHLNR